MECRWRNVRARAALCKALEKEGAISQRDLADACGVTEGLVYFWKRGERRPGRLLRPVIERLLNVPADWWLTAAELRKEKRLRAA